MIERVSATSILTFGTQSTESVIRGSLRYFNRMSESVVIKD